MELTLTDATCSSYSQLVTRANFVRELSDELGSLPLEARHILDPPPGQGTCFCLFGRHIQRNPKSGSATRLVAVHGKGGKER